MRQHLFLSAYLCILSADIMTSTPTPMLMSAHTCPDSETETTKPSPCDVEMPNLIVTIHPLVGFCISVSENDNTNLNRRMIPRSDEEKRQKKNLNITLNVNESKTNLSVKITKFSRLYPALHENIGKSWFLLLENQFTLPYFKLLSQYIVTERKRYIVFPPEDEVWTWTRMCSVEDVKVVIVGREPYSGGQGHGLSYSMRVGIKPTPTLLNIYKELKNDIQGFVVPSHAYLVGWARQDKCWQNQMFFYVSHNVREDSGRQKYKEHVRQKDIYGRWSYCNYDICLEVNDTIYYTLAMIQDNGFTNRQVYNAFTVQPGGDGETRLIAVNIPS